MIHHPTTAVNTLPPPSRSAVVGLGVRSSMGSVGDSLNKQLTGTVARVLILKTYGHEACDGEAPV